MVLALHIRATENAAQRKNGKDDTKNGKDDFRCKKKGRLGSPVPVKTWRSENASRRRDDAGGFPRRLPCRRSGVVNTLRPFGIARLKPLRRRRSSVFFARNENAEPPPTPRRTARRIRGPAFPKSKRNDVPLPRRQQRASKRRVQSEELLTTTAWRHSAKGRLNGQRRGTWAGGRRHQSSLPTHKPDRGAPPRLDGESRVYCK